MRRLLAALAATTCLIAAADAATVFPLDRATILAGSPFDLKVEFRRRRAARRCQRDHQW